jgi:predicted enzyme related to lactoylglutathione lyase
MVNFRVENIEKTVAYLRKIGTEIINEVTAYPYGEFVHILDP